MTSSHLENKFSAIWQVQYPDLPFLREYHLPAFLSWAQEKKSRGLSKRAIAMRADFAWPAAQVALEIQGGIWFKSGHSTGAGIDRDAAKSFVAQADGWVLVAFTEQMFDKQGAIWLPKLAQTIKTRQLAAETA